MKCKESHHCVVFSSLVLPDGKGRKEEIAPDWFHLHSSVQLTHDYSRFCPGKNSFLIIVNFICVRKVFSNLRYSDVSNSWQT